LAAGVFAAAATQIKAEEPSIAARRGEIQSAQYDVAKYAAATATLAKFRSLALIG
jgi:hypothetical protein